MRYEIYSASEIKWNADHPFQWKCDKSKRFFSNPKVLNKENAENNVLSLTLKGVIRNDKDKPIGLSPEDYSTYQIFHPNELVFKLIDLNNISTSRVGIVSETGIMSSAYIRFLPKTDVNIKYFYYQYFDWYKRNIFNGLGAGVRQTISGNELGMLEILVPPRDEQDQIVRYLDWQVSRINKLIEGKRKKKSILLERKKIIIFEALIGVSLKAPETKPVFLHRERTICIPSHWDTKPLCAIAKVKSIPNNTDLELLSVYLDEGVVPFSSRSEKRTNATSKDLSKYQRVDPGDFVMNNQQAWRGSVGVSDYSGIVSPAYVVLSLDDTLSRGFANYLLRSLLMVEQYLIGSKGVGSIQRNVYWPTIKRATVIVPPKDEQLEIEKTIESQTKKIDLICKAIDDEISLLQEMKNKLISDVVTGQIDVRGIEIPEYEYVEETIDDNIDDEEDTSQEVDEL